MGIRDWLQRRRDRREARRLLDRAFDTPELLAPTSLKRHHRSRTQVLGFEVKDGRVAYIEFGILRHPRPYAFSRQAHKVIEIYVYDVDAARIAVEQGVNWTRIEGRDAD